MLIEELLPGRLAGKSVLGIDCLDICIDAATRGARPVHCVLPDGILSAATKRLADKDVPVTLVAMSTPHLNGGPWDHVICSGALSHHRNPFGYLDLLVTLTRETLVIGTARTGWRGMLAGIAPILSLLLRPLPAIFVGGSGSTGKSHAPKFYFGRRSIRHMLMYHRTMFAEVKSQVIGRDNYIVASKRRIAHLILVSGPVSSGKTTFIDALLAGKLPEISMALGLEPGKLPPVLGTSRNAARGPALLPVAICHYGFLRPYMRPAAINERDEALDILKTAANITIVTLVVPSDKLVARITRGEIEVATDGKASQRHLALREIYKDEARVSELYRRWFAFTETLVSAKYVVSESNEGLSLLAYSEWVAGRKKLPSSIDTSLKLRNDDQRREAFAALALPPDLSGMRVLDVECGTGAICLEAVRRGASQVVGIDAAEDLIYAARKNVPGVEFRAGTFGQHDDLGKFDIVLCFDRMAHERDPLGYIDGLTAIARRRIAFGFAGEDVHSRNRSRLPLLIAAVLMRLPLLLTMRNGAANNRGQPKFLVSRAALISILQRHRKIFSKLRIVSPIGSGISAVVADKFQIGHLIVVAGPVSSGKSTVCRKLLAGELNSVYDQLGIAPTDRPSHVYLPRARGSKPPIGNVVLFHYNFLNAYSSTAHVHESDENLDILKAADRVSVLTVWADSQRLVRQITKSEIDGGPFHRPRKRHLQLREEYRDPTRVRFHYQNWLRFASKYAHDNLVIVQEDDTVKVLDVEQWQNVANMVPRPGA